MNGRHHNNNRDINKHRQAHSATHRDQVCVCVCVHACACGLWPAIM